MINRALPKIALAGLLVFLGTDPAYSRSYARSLTRTNPSFDTQPLVLKLSDTPADGGFQLSQDVPDTGTRIRHPIITGAGQPLSSAWDQLTNAQQADFRAHYQGLPATDEPPYPVGGLSAVYRPISDLVNRAGNLEALSKTSVGLVVAPDGRVSGVNAYTAQAPGVAPLMGRLLQDVRFKPGLCQGQPCQMEFPVEFTVVAHQ